MSPMKKISDEFYKKCWIYFKTFENKEKNEYLESHVNILNSLVEYWAVDEKVIVKAIDKSIETGEDLTEFLKYYKERAGHEYDLTAIDGIKEDLIEHYT